MELALTIQELTDIENGKELVKDWALLMLSDHDYVELSTLTTLYIGLSKEGLGLLRQGKIFNLDGVRIQLIDNQ